MIILYGTKVRERIECIVGDAVTCGRCGRLVLINIVSARVWFTLFFLPIFPVGKKRYYEVCPNCGIRYEIAPEQAQAAVRRYGAR